MSTTAFWTANTGAVGSAVTIQPGLPTGGKLVKIEQFVGGATAATSTAGMPTVQNGVALARVTVPATLANKVRISITWTNPQQVRSLFQSRNAYITIGVYHLVHKDRCLGDSGAYGQWYRWRNQASVTQIVYEGPEVTSTNAWRQTITTVPTYCALMDVGSSGSASVGGSWHDPGQGALLLTNKAPSGYLVPSLSYSALAQCGPQPSSWPALHYWGGHDDDAYQVDSFNDSGTGKPGACAADSLLDVNALGASLNSTNPPPPLSTYGAPGQTKTSSAVLYLIATVATSGSWSWSQDDRDQVSSMQFYLRGKLQR
jgi:hypothetical protein